MTKLIHTTLLISATVFFAACTSSNNNDTVETIDKTEQTDLSIIDPNAPVVELTLVAQGNTMAEMEYIEKELKVKAGSTVKLNFINRSTDGSMQHNFVLIEDGNADKVGVFSVQAGAENDFVADMPEILVHTKMLQPGSETTITFAAPKAGNYQYICTYPGHYTIMQGVFIVEP